MNSLEYENEKKNLFHLRELKEVMLKPSSFVLHGNMH